MTRNQKYRLHSAMGTIEMLPFDQHLSYVYDLLVLLEEDNSKEYEPTQRCNRGFCDCRIIPADELMSMEFLPTNEVDGFDD